ncbi:MAG: right-handed parallel beta-helix repeat-containing protein [Candidatus Eisenbacteria bacterium]
MSVRMLVFCLLASLALPSPTHAVSLQSAYDAASALSTYDKYVVLEAGARYTGGLALTYGTNTCIKGNGAVIDLEGGIILIQGTTTNLDIDHCSIVNGGNPELRTGNGALHFLGGSGNVHNNTFYMNTVGIRVYSSQAHSVIIVNNIIVKNTYGGVLCYIGNEPDVSYNNCWSNLGGNYLIDCG